MNQENGEGTSPNTGLFSELAFEIKRAIEAFEFRHGPEAAGRAIATVAGVSLGELETLFAARDDPIAADAARITGLSLYLLSPALGNGVSRALHADLGRLAGGSPLPSIFAIKTSKNTQTDAIYQFRLVAFVEMLAYQLIADRDGDDPDIAKVAEARIDQLKDSDETDQHFSARATQSQVELGLLKAAGSQTEQRSWQRHKKIAKKTPEPELVIRVSKAAIDGLEPSSDDIETLRVAGRDLWGLIDHLISECSTRCDFAKQLSLIKELHRRKTR